MSNWGLRGRLCSSRYRLIPVNDVDLVQLGNSDEEDCTRHLKLQHQVSCYRYGLLCSIFMLFVALGILWRGYLHDSGTNASSMRQSTCRTAPIRREWRSLSHREKNEYINAVLCLRTKASKIREEGLLYDDFPFVHSRGAEQSRHLLFRTHVRLTNNFSPQN